MHVVILAEYIDLTGGIERVITARANFLVREKGEQVTIVCTQKDSGKPAYELDAEVEVIFLPPVTAATGLRQRLRLYYQQSRYLIKELDPDVIVSVKYTVHNLLLSLTARRTALISELHEAKVDYDNVNRNSVLRYPKRLLRNWVFRRQDAVIVLTDSAARNWAFENTLVVPNALYTSPVKVGGNSVSLTVLGVGRLTARKHFDLLIAAWARVIEQHPRWRLRICGAGGEYAQLAAQIRDLGIEPNVELPNRFLPVEPEYRSAAIFVHASAAESFGNVLIEAMAHGLPVVAFDVPDGPRELIAEGRTGYLVPFGDVAALAERIIHLIDHPAQRRRLGEEGRSFAARFDPEIVNSRYHRILRRLVNTRAEAT